MLQDHRGLAVSTASTAALSHFEKALQQFHAYRGDPIATIDAALAEDDAFVLGHLFKAFVLATTSEGRHLPAARAAVARAASVFARTNPRERALIVAGRQLVNGDWHAASRSFDAVLREWPRDALALQTAHLMDFYRGDALNLRNRISRVLPAWSTTLPGYSYVLGMHAFGLEECNQYVEAEATARRALDIEPTDGWAVHAVTHVMEMQGRIDEGIGWLTTRAADWATDDNGFAPHNWWHLALFHLDRGAFDAALDLYDRKLDGPQSDTLLVLIDCTALLWRLQLEGVNVGDRFERVAERWHGKAVEERGFYAFNDVHAMMSFAATRRTADCQRLLAEMRVTATDGAGVNQAMTRDIGLPLAEGIQAFAQGRPLQAIERIDSVRDVAHSFGGSHAQRDLLTLTLIEAAIRAGDTSRARHLLAEREVHKPTAWSARLAARVNAAALPAAA
jgi:tetratricopeptide (TPR) repeat protein